MPQCSLMSMGTPSLQNRWISGASAIHARGRKARGQKSGGFFWLGANSRARSCIALAPLIRLFCRQGHPHFLFQNRISHMINIQWTKFERKFIVSFISEELPYIESCRRGFFCVTGQVRFMARVSPLEKKVYGVMD